jgi:benzoate-CoA ligase
MGWVVPPGYRVVPPRVNIAREILDLPTAEAGDAVAITWDGGSLTYGALADKVARCAAGLVRRGVQRGHPVILRGRNTIELCVCAIALWKLGALVVWTYSRLTEAELAFIVEDSGARIALAVGEPAQAAQALAASGVLQTAIALDEMVDGVSAFDRLLAGDAQAGTADTGALEPAFMLYSSGTTGKPKAIVHGHRWIHSMGDIVRLHMGYEPGDVAMSPGEYAFMATLGHCFLGPLASGATVALYSGSLAPQAVLTAIARHRVSKFMAVPTFFRTALAAGMNPQSASLDRVEAWICGGEALEAAVAERWEQVFGRPLYNVYGISEAQLLIGNCAAHPVKAGSLGKAMPGLKLAVLDDALEPVPPGSPGRLCLHRDDPGMFLSYGNAWDRWRKAHRGEWYETGDVVSRDVDGYYWYLGRSDDLFKTRGMLVSPPEVESVLSRHDAIAEVAVIGQPDDRIGFTVEAHVVLKPGFAETEETRAAILALARDALAAHKVPERIVFTAELPKSLVGKILRRALVRKLL